MCEKCNKDHDGIYGSGRFCSAICARSFSSLNDQQDTKEALCITCNSVIVINKRASDKTCKCNQCKKSSFSKKEKKPKRFCKVCGKVCGKNSISFCSRECHIEHKYLEYISKWKNCEVDGGINLFKDSVSGHIRRYMFEKYEHKCSICGWNTVNEYTNKIPLQIDHIDGNHMNNEESNLQLICPNCHSLTKTFGGANRGNGRRYRYNRKVTKMVNGADC